MKQLIELYPDGETADEAIRKLFEEMAKYMLKTNIGFLGYHWKQPGVSGWMLQITTVHLGTHQQFVIDALYQIDHFTAGVTRFFQFLIEQEANHLYQTGLDRMEHLRGQPIQVLINEIKQI